MHVMLGFIFCQKMQYNNTILIVMSKHISKYVEH